LPAAVKPVLSAAEKPVRRPAPPKPDARKDAGNGDEALMAQLERKGFILDARTNRHKPGTERTVDLGGGVSLVLSWCPPGWFMMGSPESEEGRKHDEVRHAVRLTKGFWIGKYEVTESQWGAVVGDGDSGEKPKCDVSWNCAQDFLKRLNARIDGASFRLPTEAEWEYACRAGAMTPFSFGVGRDGGFLDGNQATCAGRDTYPSRRKTLFGGQNAWGRDAVGSNSFYANAWGLNDMHGNVYEWCADVFAPYPSGEGVSTDPISLKGFSSTSRVIRGGCWNHAAKLCRSAFRTGKSETDRDQLTGFRVCCDDLP
jgi:formylglycine-generating enzyme required for sulfatase activity